MLLFRLLDFAIISHSLEKQPKVICELEVLVTNKKILT